MRVAPKKAITLNSSTVTASTLDEFDYTGLIKYNTDDEVKVSYESDGTTAKTPVIEYIATADSITSYPPDNPTEWSETGTANQWAMFDNYINSATSDTSDITVEVGSARSDLVGLFGLVGTSVTLALTRNGSTLKTEEISLKTPPAVSYYSWMFDEYEYIDRVFWEYPKYADAALSVTITTARGSAECGEMVLGSVIFLGKTQYGASVGIEDYSTYSTDLLGRTYLNQGAYADRAEIEIWLYNDTLDSIRRKLAEARGVMSLWDLNNTDSDYDSLRIYGFYEAFDVIIPGPTISKCSLTIRGTT